MSEITPADNETDGRVLSFSHSLRAVLGLCFVSVMVAIDQTVVGTAMPSIVAELKEFELYAWVATAYLLASLVTVPVFGRLGDFYGRKPFVVASVLVFTLGSILCSLSGTMLGLVMARAIQGIGGGMLIGTAFACIPDLFPDARVRLRWQVLLSAAFGIANGVGPTLGGILTQYWGWRSVFYVNIPIGLIGLFMVWRYLPWIRYRMETRISLDWQGAILIALGFGSLQLFIELAPRQGPSLMVLMLGAMTLMSTLVLLWWEKKCPEPLLPLAMFRDRSLASLFILSLFVGCLMFVLLFYVPLMLQGGFGMSPREAGLAVTPLVVCITLGSVVNGRVVMLLPKPNFMLYIGFGLLAICVAGLMVTSKTTSAWVMSFYLVLGGFGMGFVMPNLTVFAQQVAGRSLLGISTAMLQSTRLIGGMLGTALVGTLVTYSYVNSVQQAVPYASQAPWGSALFDPQLLMNQAIQSNFVAELFRYGLNGAALIESARVSLVDAVHVGLTVTLLIAIIATLWVARVPFINLGRKVSQSGKTGGGV